MRKTPPVPVPPGEKFCFICETCLPEDAFRLRQGKRYSPCRACSRKSDERREVMNQVMERAIQEVRDARAAPRREGPPVFPEFDLPPHLAALWGRQKAAMTKRYKASLRPPKENHSDFVPRCYR